MSLCECVCERVRALVRACVWSQIKYIHKSSFNKQVRHKVLWWEQRTQIQTKLLINKKRKSLVCVCVCECVCVRAWWMWGLVLSQRQQKPKSESVCRMSLLPRPSLSLINCLSASPLSLPFFYVLACFLKSVHQKHSLRLWLLIKWLVYVKIYI